MTPVRIRRHRQAWHQVAFLLAFSLPPIAAFGTLSFFALVKPNWLLPATLL